MRTPLLGATLCVVALCPALAQAQYDAQRASAKGAGHFTASLAADEAPAGEGSARLQGGAPAAAPEGNTSAHTVEKGDTLWDLSQKFLGSPWYWPKVWSYNPEIANPHWIYPGNVVRFVGAGEEGPTQVEAGTGPEDVEEGSMVIDDDDRVAVAGQIGYVPKKAVSLQSTGFVTTAEVEESGSITGSFGESTMLSFPNTVYAEFKNNKSARLGETFVVFRPGGELVHPTTQVVVGYLTKIVGAVRVVRVDKGGVSTLAIDKQFDEIKRGDLLGPLGESLLRTVAARPNDREIKDAVIVGAVTTYLSQHAEHSMIIIDRGADDGVKPGNTFIITRQHDPSDYRAIVHPEVIDERWPKEDVAACMAFEVKSKASTCLMTRSMREVVKGDRVEMRAAGTRSAMR